jgi:hypothetical protein
MTDGLRPAGLGLLAVREVPIDGSPETFVERSVCSETEQLVGA